MSVTEEQIKELTRQVAECNDEAQAVELAKKLRVALHKYLWAPANTAHSSPDAHFLDTESEKGAA